MNETILIMAAGTGGHVIPALACAREFKKRGYTVHWLGTLEGIENKIINPDEFQLHRINIQGIRGKSLLGSIKSFLLLFRSLIATRKIIKRVKPVCVLGFGSYIAGPGALLSRFYKIPTVIHEQNSIPGTTNRLLYPVAHRILEGFPRSFKSSSKVTFVGNPVRPELFHLQNNRDISKKTNFHILVLGGSLGSESLNRLLPQAIGAVSNKIKIKILHQTGHGYSKKTSERYKRYLLDNFKVLPFISDMTEAYEWADLAICRSGASTLSELMAVGIPSLLIPLPSAIDSHQYYNAKFMEYRNAAILLEETAVTYKKIARCLEKILTDPHLLKNMASNAQRLAKPDAVNNVVDSCLDLANV